MAWLVGGCIGVCLIIGLLCAHAQGFSQLGFVVGWSVGVVWWQWWFACQCLVCNLWNTRWRGAVRRNNIVDEWLRGGSIAGWWCVWVWSFG